MKKFHVFLALLLVAFTQIAADCNPNSPILGNTPSAPVATSVPVATWTPAGPDLAAIARAEATKVVGDAQAKATDMAKAVPTAVPSNTPTSLPNVVSIIVTTATPTASSGSSQSATNPVTTTATSGGQGTCPQARDLGPWAPTANGVGLQFEVTASDSSVQPAGSAGVVLGLWWPHGNTPWGNKEVTTFLARGLSIEVQNGAGRGWDYEGSCPADLVQTELKQHMVDRPGDTSYHSFVEVDELVRMKLVVVRFDRRGQKPVVVQPAAQPTTAPVATATKVAQPVATPAPSTSGGNTASCKATRAGDSDNMATVTAPAGSTYVVETWGGQTGNAFVVIVGPGSQDKSWQGGAIWSYGCTDATQVYADLAGRGKPILVSDGGKLYPHN